MGAGMGGGSADGAFMIKMLNEKFLLELDEEKMKFYALQLGSDCPFFISNKPSHATSRGEILTEIECDLRNKILLIVNPGIHVSTAEAFGKITISDNSISTAEIVKQPIETWKGLLENDFEKTVFHHHPEIKEIKDTLYERGAAYASMTGSGSTVYGIFDHTIEEKIFTTNNYEIIEIKDGKSFQK
jgi:4-diphosphocytidyl-2-C-methyl-D-erythritol kinase